MGKMSRLGNALYEGDVSIDFVGRKWLWYAISGIIVLLAVGGPLLQGPQLRHRVRGRRRVQGQPARRPGHPGQRRQDPHRRRRHRHRRGLLADREHLRRVDPRADRGARATTRPPRSPRPSPRRSTSMPQDDISAHGRRRQLGRTGRQARADRPGRLPRPGGAVHLGLLPRVEDVRRGDRRPGPRHRDHHRRLRALRLRGHPGHGHRPADDPRVLALRHRRRLRQGPGEHPNLRQSRKTYAELANLAVNQTLVRSINTSIVALLPVGAILYVGVATLGSGALKDLALVAVRRHGRRCLLLDLHRHAARGAAEVRTRRRSPSRTPGRRRAPRRDVDRYADVPCSPTTCRCATTDDDVRPGGRGRRRTSAPAPAPPRRPEASGSGRVVPEPEDAAARLRARRAHPAHPAAALQARQVSGPMTLSRGRGLSALIAVAVRDIPDFPKPGVTFKDITPLLDDHAAFTAVVEALATPVATPTARSWSTRSSAWRPAGSSSRRRSRWRSASASCRSASPASCRGDARGQLRARVRRGDPRDAPRRPRAGRAGAGRRRRARHRWHRRATAALVEQAEASCTASRCCWS